jgi:hypothetical protein
LLVAHGTGIPVGPGLFRVTLNTGIVDHCRAVLARWGRPAVEPVPVSERAPGPEDCDDQGRCWWLFEGSNDYEPCWTLRKMYGIPFERTRYLPHWALPLPQEGADGQH